MEKGRGLMDTASFDVAVLCGGLGTRLRAVLDDRPKPMAPINGQPFLDLVIDYVVSQGFRRMIFCTGHHGDWIARHVSHRTDIHAALSQEGVPLGTAGALRACRSLMNSATVLVLNGDSLCRVDLHALLAAHHASRAVATIAVVPSNDRTDGGGVTMDEAGRILAFHEKQAGQYLNAGIYAIQREALTRFPESVPCSLERDVFPRLLRGECYGHVCKAPLYDIGTPARLAEFQALQERASRIDSQEVECVSEV